MIRKILFLLASWLSLSIGLGVIWLGDKYEVDNPFLVAAMCLLLVFFFFLVVVFLIGFIGDFDSHSQTIDTNWKGLGE